MLIISYSVFNSLADGNFFVSGLDKESTFVPYTEDSKLPQQDVYHFITECFFLTHQALHIAYSIVYKVLKLNSAVARLRRLYETIKTSYPKRVIELVKQQLNNGK